MPKMMRAAWKEHKQEEKAKRVQKARQRGKRDSHRKFIPKVEEVSSTQFKAPKPPKPDNTQQLKTLSRNVETLKTRTAQLK